MRGAFVAAVGAAAIVLSSFGLAVVALRAGPLEATMEASTVEVHAEGTYQSRAASSPALGLCPVPPCTAATAVDLRLRGLPDVAPAAYVARLEGDGSEDLGPLRRDGKDHLLQWDADEDHTGKDRIVVFLAGRAIATVPVRASDAPARIDATVPASWGASPAEARLAEIGAVTVSTVASARLDDGPPEGWEFRAFLEGREGRVPFGALSAEDGASTLDGRVERVRLASQERLVILLAPHAAGDEAGFPVLDAML